ncbi:MAG TPA: FkbM family methyltransferase [bacterium]
MNLRRLPAYLGACARAALTSGPRAYLRMLSRSPYTVKDLPRYGVSMLVDVRDGAISKPILALGDYEAGFARRLLSAVGPETHFVDVGANIGFFTLAVARRADRGHVWSVEPDDRNVRLLRASLALNGLEGRVEVHHLAASDANGEVFFSTLGYDALIGSRFTAKDEAALLARSLAGAAPPTRVPARTVDLLVGDARVDVVKIDVEGHEPAVLAGMAGVLCRQRPLVFAEFAPGTIRHISGTDPAEMLRQVVACDYALAIVEKSGAVTSLGADAGAVMARHDDRRHHLDLLLTPRERMG